MSLAAETTEAGLLRLRASAGVVAPATRVDALPGPPAVPLLDFKNRQTYFDFNKFMRLTQGVPTSLDQPGP